MIQKSKISAVMLALMFAAGGAMAQSAGMSNTGDDNSRATDSPAGTATKNSTADTRMKSSSTKAKPAKKAKKMKDGSTKPADGINTDPNGNVSNPENRPTTNP